MNENLKIFILFLLIVFSGSTTARVKWLPIQTSIKAEQIIGGTGINDYWLLDNKNTISHYLEDKWKAFPVDQLFSETKFRLYQPVFIQKGRLLVLLTDMDWKTHIAEIKDGKIIHYSFVSEYPLNRITHIADTIYATGNFGIVLKLQNGYWTKVRTPFHSHIHFTAADKKGKLWFGTNNEGVWSWNGKEYHHYRNPDEISKASITGIKIIHDTLYIITSKDITYKLVNESFHFVRPGEIPFSKSIKLLSNGYYKVVSNNNKVRFIPYLYKIKSFKELQDGHALLLTQNNQLYIDRYSSRNYFLDFASISGLEGPKYTYVPILNKSGNSLNSLYRKLRPGIIFSDFNNDFYQDILLFNISDERHPFLYLNNKKHYFNNFAGPLGLDNFTFNGFLSYAFDLNGDNTPEIISSDFRNNNYFLNILEKTAGKYQLSTTIPIPQKYAVKPLLYLDFTDIDRDGDLDIALVFGYSESGKGSIVFLKNDRHGNFNITDTTRANDFSGWNVQTLFADFNNDGLDDMAVARNWGPNVIYYQNRNHGWTARRLPSPKNFRSQQRKSGMIAFDFDNDGDLDIVNLAEQPFIRILENDGKGNFTDITQKSGLNILNTGKKNGQITAGDFDDNGFIDLFVCVYSGNEWENFIFLNDSSHTFTDQSENMGVSNGKVEFVATGDIDNDGDLDIYGFRKGRNTLWINNLNDNNFLRFRLRGIKSNSNALGAKIWLYEAGHLNDDNYLSGYQQTGSKLSGRDYQNESIVHFGVNNKKKYDVRIVFPAGKTKILRNLVPGKTIQVTEISAPLSWFYLADQKGYILLRNKEFLSYFTIVVIGLFLLMTIIYYGTKKFSWDVQLTTIIIAMNLIIFGVLLIALYSSTTNLKYYLPLAVIIFGSLGPFGFFMWIKRFNTQKSQKEHEYTLFQALQNFSHGAWASSNLNSLQLFLENLSADDLRDKDYILPFEKRKETFINMTLPVIREIVLITKNADIHRNIALEIEKYEKIMTGLLSSDFTQMNTTGKEQLSMAIMKLRESLSRFKKIIFAGHSCYPSIILENLKEEFENIASAHKVKLKILNFLSADDAVLMGTTELADILENCIRNSVKAMSENTNKKLVIKLIKGDPRFFIEVTDNGCGISKESQKQIFENGYSTTNSTGYGLYYAKSTLSKYGGRIYIKTSIPNQRTTFIIELQKGSKR